MEVATASHPTSTRQPEYRVEVSEPALRDDLLEYLRNGGWVAEPVEERELTASWPHGRNEHTERISLQFSVAVWRVMNGNAEVSVHFAAETAHADVTEERPEPEFVVTSLTDLSHELRNPLTSILGYLDAVLAEEAGALTDEQREHLEVVDRNARRLAGLADELRFLTDTKDHDGEGIAGR